MTGGAAAVKEENELLTFGVYTTGGLDLTYGTLEARLIGPPPYVPTTCEREP